jgi:rod shape determining protein RodA
MKNLFRSIDWILVSAVVLILGAGLVTMNSFGQTSTYFDRQIIWISISFAIFFFLSLFDFRFLKRTNVTVILFLGMIAMLAALFIMGHVSKGAQSWFHFGFFSVEPSDPAQIVVIILLAKYFSRRHIEIRNIRHIIISGLYAFIICLMILAQPDFGGAVIIFFIWFGMVLVSGISRKHVFAVLFIGAMAFAGLWFNVLKPYQQERIKTFINPMGDIHGAGYNSDQSTIAIGSGQLLGKGLGYGTQSKLNFLPEYRTDFIFAAFAEEWGFVGVAILLMLYAIVIWRILVSAIYGASNFEILYALGVAVLLSTHFIINVGMNIGLLPVTGVTVPFMSYGGSHLVTEMTALGIMMGMRRYMRTAPKELSNNEFLDVQ